jgi:hypothetical protein
MIVLVTSDDVLRRSLTKALTAAVVVHSRAESLRGDPHLDVSCAVLDCRESADARTEMLTHRAYAEVGRRCIGIVRADGAERIRAISTIGDEVLDAIIPGSDVVADVVTAHLNDPSKTIAAACALEMLLRLLPKSTHPTISIVLTSGFRVCTVKHLAIHHRRHRTSVGRTLRAVSGWTQAELIDLAKAVYALILDCDVGLARNAIGRCIGYAKPASIAQLHLRVFGTASPELACSSDGVGVVVWLGRAIATANAARTPPGGIDGLPHLLGTLEGDDLQGQVGLP